MDPLFLFHFLFLFLVLVLVLVLLLPTLSDCLGREGVVLGTNFLLHHVLGLEGKKGFMGCLKNKKIQVIQGKEWISDMRQCQLMVPFPDRMTTKTLCGKYDLWLIFNYTHTLVFFPHCFHPVYNFYEKVPNWIFCLLLFTQKPKILINYVKYFWFIPLS